MPSAHCKQQATEDPEYENKGGYEWSPFWGFKSIWAAATGLGVSPFSNVATP